MANRRSAAMMLAAAALTAAAGSAMAADRTATNTAVQDYLNEAKVPQLFIATGAAKWNDPKHHQWTMAFTPSYPIEARIYGRYILKSLPDAKIAVLYQNDHFGKGYIVGVREALGERADEMIVAMKSYEMTDPTVDSQVVALQASGADVLLTAAVPKFAAQAVKSTTSAGSRCTSSAIRRARSAACEAGGS
jgi:branched-chain amino acid transport system substrate-binding protein